MITQFNYKFYKRYKDMLRVLKRVIQGDGSFGKRKGGVASISFTWRSGWCLLNCLNFFKATHHMVWELKSRLDEIGLLSTPNMCCGLVKGKVILHQALLSGGCN